MNKIYLITRTDDCDYDEYDATAIIAKTPKKAKEYAFKEYYGNFKEGKIICQLIGIANKKQPLGEIVSSFNAG